MSAVCLESYDGRVRDLPELCMKCGAPATLRKDKTFSWYPPWVGVLLLAGLIPFLIVALILTKRSRVEVPLCDRHKGHWMIRQLVVIGSLLFLLAGGFLAFLATVNNKGNDSLSAAVCIGWVVLMIGWVVLAVMVQSTSIRPKEITDTSITLTSVSELFVAAYEDEWDEERDRLDELARERWERGRRPRAARPPVEGADRVRTS